MRDKNICRGSGGHPDIYSLDSIRSMDITDVKKEIWNNGIDPDEITKNVNDLLDAHRQKIGSGDEDEKVSFYRIAHNFLMGMGAVPALTTAAAVAVVAFSLIAPTHGRDFDAEIADLNSAFVNQNSMNSDFIRELASSLNEDSA